MPEKLRPLRDIIKKNLKILFVGARPGELSSKMGHYFPGNSNVFWKLLHQSGLTNEQLSSEQDCILIEYNYGLTDMVKKPKKGSTFSFTDTLNCTNRFSKLLSDFTPKIVAFVGKRGFQIYNQRNDKKYDYGTQGKQNSISLYLVPSPSGQSYADTSYKEKLHWYSSLKHYSDRIN